MSAILPNLVSSLDLLRMYSVLSSSLSVKVLDNIGLTIDHLCALLVTSHQLDGKHWFLPFSMAAPLSTAQQYNTMLLFFMLIFCSQEGKKFKIPMEKGRPKFWREVGRERSQSLRSCLSTYNKKNKEWTIFFFFPPKELVTTRFSCFVEFFYWSREIFQGSMGFISTADQAVISPKHCKNLAQYKFFLWQNNKVNKTLKGISVDTWEFIENWIWIIWSCSFIITNS